MAYNGNPNLKRQHEIREYSHAELAEMVRCAQDIEYFVERYATIITLDKGKQIISLYDYQKEMLKMMSGETIKDEKYNIITLAPRQCGKCVTGDTIINIENTETHERSEITIKEFHESLKGDN
jgi:hypothetical protein